MWELRKRTGENALLSRVEETCDLSDEVLVTSNRSIIKYWWDDLLLYEYSDRSNILFDKNLDISIVSVSDENKGTFIGSCHDINTLNYVLNKGATYHYNVLKSAILNENIEMVEFICKIVKDYSYDNEDYDFFYDALLVRNVGIISILSDYFPESFKFDYSLINMLNDRGDNDIVAVILSKFPYLKEVKMERKESNLKRIAKISAAILAVIGIGIVAEKLIKRRFI